MSETEVGNISRQEAVSMIPPLFLDIKSHHYILDMCAAPGSKTAQIMEALHAQDALNCSSSSGGDGDECMSNIPKGLIIANDSDYDRACMLVHQTSRIQSPCLLVTNHEAQSFPNIVLSQQDSSSTNIEGGGNNGKKFLMFDRILADVPCSGDGTMRKNPRIWNTWDGHSGNALHRLQMQILERGLQMTKVGGRIVYSTCSFNPVENEAVVAALLNMAKGSLKIVDVSDQYPKLKRNPGLTSWKVMDKKGNMYSSLDEVDQPHQKNIYASSFPPSNAKELGLEKW